MSIYQNNLEEVSQPLNPKELPLSLNNPDSAKTNVDDTCCKVSQAVGTSVVQIVWPAHGCGGPSYIPKDSMAKRESSVGNEKS